MSWTGALGAYIPQAAKAVAAFVAPFVIAGLAWLSRESGMDVPWDPSLIETTIVAAVTAAATWATRNRPPTITEED